MSKFLDQKGLQRVAAWINEKLKGKQDKLAGVPGQVVGFDAEGNAIPQASVTPDNVVTVPGGGAIEMGESLGEGPYIFEFEEDGEGSAVSAAQVSYDGTASGLEAETVQGAVDLLCAQKAAVGRVSNLNLLSNWYFAKPVNQRSVSGTISAPGYFIDCWKLVSGSVTIAESGLVLDGTIVQLREDGVGPSATASVLTAQGIIPAEYDDDSKAFSITAAGQTLVAAKLELGPVQTLAHQDADGNWVLNDPPPDPALELLKCQRYQIELNPLGNNYAVVGLGLASKTNEAYISVPLPVSMRPANPDLAVSGKWALTSGAAYMELSSVKLSRFEANRVLLECATKESSLATGAAYYLQAFDDAAARLLLDNNL